MLASTSSIHDFNSMVIIPCSLKTLALIANSIQSNLLTRTALNFLRLRKPLILVIRETPITTLDLLNMLKASIAGSVIFLASPAFYNDPKNVRDIVDYIVGKVLDLLNIKNDLYKRWDGAESTRGRYLCAQFFGQECL